MRSRCRLSCSLTFDSLLKWNASTVRPIRMCLFLLNVQLHNDCSAICCEKRSKTEQMKTQRVSKKALRPDAGDVLFFIARCSGLLPFIQRSASASVTGKRSRRGSVHNRAKLTIAYACECLCSTLFPPLFLFKSPTNAHFVLICAHFASLAPAARLHVQPRERGDGRAGNDCCGFSIYFKWIQFLSFTDSFAFKTLFIFISVVPFRWAPGATLGRRIGCCNASVMR